MTKHKQEECYYWPLWFSYILPKSEQKYLAIILPKIQTAQLFLWRALNIYDDLLDGDCQPNKKLLRANNYYRRFLTTHFELHLSSEYYQLLNKFLSLWEISNQREIKNRQQSLSEQIKKLKNNKLNLTTLADKSLILAAGPLALLFCLKYSHKDPVVKEALNFWRYFLSAKQLSDDSHDWEADLKNNLITTANAPVATQINFKGDLFKEDGDLIINNAFIRQAAPKIISDLKNLANQAEMSIKKINSDKSLLILEKLIKPIEEAAYKSEDFLKMSGLYLL